MAQSYASVLDPEVHETDISKAEALKQFRELQSQHQFWNNRLFRACRQGYLAVEDFRFIFSQYYLNYHLAFPVSSIQSRVMSHQAAKPRHCPKRE